MKKKFLKDLLQTFKEGLDNKTIVIRHNLTQEEVKKLKRSMRRARSKSL